jgi:hypothetical protein
MHISTWLWPDYLLANCCRRSYSRKTPIHPGQCIKCTSSLLNARCIQQTVTRKIPQAVHLDLKAPSCWPRWSTYPQYSILGDTVINVGHAHNLLAFWMLLMAWMKNSGMETVSQYLSSTERFNWSNYWDLPWWWWKPIIMYNDIFLRCFQSLSIATIMMILWQSRNYEGCCECWIHSECRCGLVCNNSRALYSLNQLKWSLALI